VAVYNVNENLTLVLLSAMHTCVMSHLLVLALVLVLLQLVLTTTLIIIVIQRKLMHVDMVTC